MSVLMIFASCSMDTSYDDSNEIEEKTNTEKQDDSENNEEEPSKEEPSKEEPSKEEPSKEEPKTCEIDEDTNILELNYFVCVNNSQTKLSPSINDESQAKKDTFFIRDYVDCVSKYIEIRVGYNNKKLNFSSVNDSYIITNVMKKDSIINITIEWK